MKRSWANAPPNSRTVSRVEMKMSKILVVEDQPAHQEEARRALEAAGYQVVVASSFREGRALLEEGEFDGVISDVYFRAGPPPQPKAPSRLPNLPVEFQERIRKRREQERGKAPGERSEASFPEEVETPEEPLGTAFVLHARSLNVPGVLCSSEYHHGSKLRNTCEIARMLGIQVIDSCVYPPEGQYWSWDEKDEWYSEKSSPQKNWAQAIQLLIEEIEKKK